MLEFLQNHSQVIHQPPFDSPTIRHQPLCPGLRHVHRHPAHLQQPTEEDHQFPDTPAAMAATLEIAMESFKDESFIQQFLSRLIASSCSACSTTMSAFLEIDAIHDERGYKAIRNKLSEQYNLSIQEPNIQVHDAMCAATARLPCSTSASTTGQLDEASSREVLRHLRLWGFECIGLWTTAPWWSACRSRPLTDRCLD